MAQQASPKVAGNNDAFRVQLTNFSTLVSSTPLGSFSSRPMALPLSSSLHQISGVATPQRFRRSSWSIPVETAAPPGVGEDNCDGDDEQDDLDQPQHAERNGRLRPGVEED